MSSGKKIALMETLTAPAREIVGRHANERRRVSDAHEARATVISSIIAGRPQRLGFGPGGYDSARDNDRPAPRG